MGFDLMSHANGNYFRWNLIDWPKVLALGRMFGWRPAGTIRYAEDGSPDPGWDGGYVTNDLQVVSTEDAAALADALERALGDIPDTPQIRTRTIAGMAVLNLDDAVNASPLLFFSLPGAKDHLRRFIDFCRAGAFSIG
jgi:hypothetical protein